MLAFNWSVKMTPNQKAIPSCHSWAIKETKEQKSRTLRGGKRKDLGKTVQDKLFLFREKISIATMV